MPKTAMIRARTEPKLKREVERIFLKLGFSSSEAINIFYRQVKLFNGLPFAIKIPNKTTLKAFKDSEAGRNMKRFVKTDDLIEDLKSR